MDTTNDLGMGAAYGCLALISLGGIFCNGLTIVVISTTKLRQHSSYCYIRGLAAFDLCSLLILCEIHADKAFTYMGLIDAKCKLYGTVFYLAHIAVPLANVFAGLTMWTTTTVAIERYAFVRFPFGVRRYCKPHVARCVLTGITTVGFLVHVPYFFMYSPVLVETNSTSTTNSTADCYVFNYTEFTGTAGFTVYRWTRTLLVQATAIILICLFSILLVYHFRKSSRVVSSGDSLARASSSVSSTPGGSSNTSTLNRSSENRMTVTLTVIVIESLVFYTLLALTDYGTARRIFGGPNKDGFYSSQLWEVIKLVNNSCETLKSCANFVIYVLVNRNFTRHLNNFCRSCHVRTKVQPKSDVSQRRKNLNENGASHTEPPPPPEFVSHM